MFDESENITFNVVINHEKQYSIWPANRENAPGWQDAGFSGSKKQCLDFIEGQWTDMRPDSLRKAMSGA
jgi:MbtH protein